MILAPSTIGLKVGVCDLDTCLSYLVFCVHEHFSFGGSVLMTDDRKIVIKCKFNYFNN